MLDVERFNDLVNLIYSTTVDSAAWGRVLGEVQRALGGCGALLGMDHLAGPSLLEFTGYDEDAMRSFESTYAGRSYVWSLLPQTREGGVIHDRSVLPPELRRTDVFANEWVRRYDTADCVVRLLVKRGPVSAFSVFARSPGSGGFDEQALALERLLAPHIQRALQIRAYSDVARVEAQLGMSALENLSDAVLFVTRDLRLTYANRRGQQLLASANAVVARNGYISCADPGRTSRLRRMVALSLGALEERFWGSAMMLDEEHGGRLALFCVPLVASRHWLSEAEAATMLLISDPDTGPRYPEALLTELFDLTPAEARLTRRLLGGDTLSTAASRLGVSRATVSTQVKAVFRKTGTARQAELIGLLRGLPKAGPTRERSEAREELSGA
jgi:DNA-binding CsgD family transcriptional regulator/PAS domain-containing protein